MGPHEDVKSTWEEQDIERDHKNLGDESLDTKNYAKNSLSRGFCYAGLFKSQLLSFLKKVRFSNQEFATNISISNIKYNYSRFKNNNFF